MGAALQTQTDIDFPEYEWRMLVKADHPNSQVPGCCGHTYLLREEIRKIQNWGLDIENARTLLKMYLTVQYMHDYSVFPILTKLINAANNLIEAVDEANKETKRGLNYYDAEWYKNIEEQYDYGWGYGL